MPDEMGEAMSEWDRYETRYASERPGTFQAYVEVWNASAAARSAFSGWALFSQCANAEPAKRQQHPDRVKKAEAIMVEHGYEIGASTQRGARTWRRKR